MFSFDYSLYDRQVRERFLGERSMDTALRMPCCSANETTSLGEEENRLPSWHLRPWEGSLSLRHPL